MNFDKSWIYARKPLVPRGKAGSFDKDGIKPPAQIVTYNDEHWIFYGGMNERHYSIGRDMKIGLAKLRLDGFICLRARHEPGTVVTMTFADVNPERNRRRKGSYQHFNQVSNDESESLRVELEMCQCVRFGGRVNQAAAFSDRCW